MTRSDARSVDRVPRLLLGFSLCLLLFLTGETLVRLLGLTGWYNRPTVAFSGEYFVGVLTSFPFVVGIGYASRWLRASGLPAERHARVWRWTDVGVAASLAINLTIMVVVPPRSSWVFLAWLRWAVALGGGIGLIVGANEARAIQNALEAERSSVRAEHLKGQRDLLDYLNSLLRHEVLNAANVISGYAALLREEYDEGDDGYRYSRAIHRKSEDITSVVEDVRVLLRATEGTAEFEPVDLAAVLRQEIEKLNDVSASVTVETSIPETAYVEADALLPRVFGNLLSNAVEHNESAAPTVRVTVEEGADAVAVEIADDGPGLPEEEIERLFERPGETDADHGLGLFLVERLVGYYGGSIELVETGAEGTAFRVTIPKEAPDPDDRGGDGAASPFDGSTVPSAAE